LTYDLRRGRADAAEARIRHAIEAFGETGPRIRLLLYVLLISNKLDEARAIAGRQILAPDERDRGGGLYYTATIDVLEGRFSAAFAAFEAALPLQRRYGMYGTDLDEVITSLHELAPLVSPPDADRYAEELAARHALYGKRAAMGLIKYETALRKARPGQCPSEEAIVGSTVNESNRTAFHAYALRLANQFGCATCEQVVRAGMSPFEDSPRSLYLFARCAERQGQLELARDALKPVDEPATTDLLSTSLVTSAFYFVSARLVRARVLARLGDAAGARAEYQAFINAWGHADRPVPEVAEARAELARLH
jgi:hypothetical protein